ncbi:unnamed protein product [Merluccius merluccius]
MGCRTKGEKKYEVTMKEAEGRGKLLDGLRIKDCRVVAQNVVTDEMILSFLNLPEAERGNTEEEERRESRGKAEEERRESRGKAEQEAPGRGAEREKEPPREEEGARPGERQEEQDSVQEVAGAPEDGDRSGDDLSDVRPDTEEEMDEGGGGERDKEGVEVGQRGAQRSSWTDDDLDDDEEVEEEMDGEGLDELCRRSLDRTTKAQMKRTAEQKRLKDGLAKAKKQ